MHSLDFGTVDDVISPVDNVLKTNITIRDLQ